MTRLCQHRPWIASGVAVAIVSVGLHYATDGAFGNRWLTLFLAILLSVSLIVMGWGTEVWTARSLGLGWILAGVALFFGGIGLSQFGVIDGFSGWLLSLVRGCLWVGAVLFAVGVTQWLRSPDEPGARGARDA